MPTYDYACRACDHRFEVYQQITEGAKRKCPRCKKPKLERLIGPGAAILFKGSGFYQTDYRSDSYKKAQAAESSSTDSKPSGDSMAAKSGDAKPTEAKASESKPSDSKQSAAKPSAPKPPKKR